MTSRRQFLKLSATGLAVAVLPSTALLTGCNTQSVLIGLLNEMQTAWTALAAALGTTVPSTVSSAFGAAVNAVKAWVPGSAVQDVVQALQILSTDVAPLLSGAFPVEVAAGEVVLGTIVNIIEFLDPASVPPVASAALVQAKSHTYKPAAKLTVVALNSHAAEVAIRKAKADFEVKWQAVTGRKAA